MLYFGVIYGIISTKIWGVVNFIPALCSFSGYFIVPAVLLLFSSLTKTLARREGYLRFSTTLLWALQLLSWVRDVAISFGSFIYTANLKS